MGYPAAYGAYGGGSGRDLPGGGSTSIYDAIDRKLAVYRTASSTSQKNAAGGADAAALSTVRTVGRVWVPLDQRHAAGPGHV